MKIPEELLSECEKGNVLLIIGHKINQDLTVPYETFLQLLAERANYPATEAVILASVAEYYELHYGRHNLVTILRDALKDAQPTTLHRAIVNMICATDCSPVREVVTLCYDDLLEQTLGDSQISYNSITRMEEIPFHNEDRLLIVHLWGRQEQPDSLIITWDDKDSFSTQSGSIYSWICGDLAQLTWLCLGIDMNDRWFRNLYSQVFKPLGQFGRRAYACGETVDETSRLWWGKRNVEFLPHRMIDLLSDLTSQLQAKTVKLPSASVSSIPQVRIIEPLDEPIDRLPYKELRYYEPQDEVLFFGRDAEKRYLLQQVLANRLTILTGPSGAGKSSLLNAGIVPRLEREGFAIGTTRLIGDPMTRLLDEALRPLANLEFPNTDRVSLADCLHLICEQVNQPIVLIIDQFEEFFARPLARQTRHEFLAELMNVVIDRSLPVRIVLSLRSDWVHALRALDEWYPDALNYEVRIRRFDLVQARQAITGPLELLEIPYEAELIDEIITDLLQEVREGTIAQDDTLVQELIDPPQLQLVCHALYTAAEDKPLTVNGYEEIGRAKGILKGYLHRKLTVFGSEQEVAQHILEALVTPWDTKAARTLAEIAAEVSSDETQVAYVLERLVNDRLVRRDVREGFVYYELAHEYLVDEINLTEEMRALKRAEHWLAQGLEEWRLGHTLLGRDQFRTINQEREHIRPHLSEWPVDARAMLLRCALQYDLDIAYWLDQVQAGELKRSILLETLQESEDPTSRTKAAEMLGEDLDAEIETVLLHTCLQADTLSLRQAAAASLKGCSEKVRKQLIVKVRTGEQTEAIRALETLRSAGTKSEIDDLMSVAAGRDIKKRTAAIEALDNLNEDMSLRWLWIRNREFFLGDLSLFLIVLMVLLVSWHYLAIAGLGAGTAWLTSPLLEAFLRNPLILSYRLQWAFIMPIVFFTGVLVFVNHWWFHAIKRGFALLLIVLIGFIGTFNCLYRQYEVYMARTKPATVYNRAEYELINANNTEMARRLFEGIYPYSKEKVLIEAWLVGIDYLESNYVEAVIGACNWLTYDSSITPEYDEVADSLITTLHWSLYQVGHTMPLQNALDWRDSLFQTIDPESLCVKQGELSPFFFGISPDSRAFLIELKQKYAPPELYQYLGTLSGHPELYPVPSGAIPSLDDQSILTAILVQPQYVEGHRDEAGNYYPQDRYAHWGAFLTRNYAHSSLYNAYSYGMPIEVLREIKVFASGATLAQALAELNTEPDLGIAKIELFLDPDINKQYADILTGRDSPWVDDIYALLMYLWSQTGDSEQVFHYYAKLSELDHYQVICRFCSPWSVLSKDVNIEQLEKLVFETDSELSSMVCAPPYLIDLVGLRQVSEGRYPEARDTFEQFLKACPYDYTSPVVYAVDYLQFIMLIEAIEQSPTEENYLRFFEVMDQSWSWDRQGEIPNPKTWFLQNAFYRTHNWPIDTFLRINPWSIYARLLLQYADQFSENADTNIRIPASLLQAAWIYDVMSAYPGEVLTEEERVEYTDQLRTRAIEALNLYLELYFERRDIPPQFCRYYQGNDPAMPNYNVTQDCVLEWIALLPLGAYQDEYAIDRYREADIIAMQAQVRELVEKYPEHHLANNLLNWMAWGYCYRANLYTSNSQDYLENYTKALNTYHELLEKYPDGTMAENAEERIDIVRDKLRNVESRDPVPEGRWTWDLAEKPAPQLTDVIKLLMPAPKR